MANPHRGSVALQVGAQAYTLSLSVNAMCELEEALGKPLAQIAENLGKPEDVRLSTVRALLWAALRDHHEEVTPRQAGEIATDAGIPAVMEKIGKAFALAFPAQKPGAGDGSRPPKAQAR